MTKKNYTYVLILIILVVAFLFSCTAPSTTPTPSPAPSPAPAAAGPIKVGGLFGLTGFMAHDAGFSEQGVAMKLEEIGYEFEGRKIEYIKEDTASDPVVAVDKARKLVENDKVAVIFGPLNDASGEAVAAYTAKSRTINIPVHSHVHEAVENRDNVFMWAGTTPGYGYYLGLYAYDKLGYRTAVACGPDLAEGEDIIGGAIEAFESRGGKVLNRVRYAPDARDLAPYFGSLGKADVCFFWAFGGFIAPFVTQYHSYGLDMPIMIPIFDVASEEELASIGDNCLGMVGTDFYTSEIDSPLSNQFVDAYNKKYGAYPAPTVAGGYAAACLFLEAVKATKGDTSPDALINALNKVKAKTPIGDVSMSKEFPGLGVIDLYVAKTVKKGSRYTWDVIDKYSQIVVYEHAK